MASLPYAVGFAALIAFASPAAAQPLVPFQGALFDAAGNPATDGNRKIIFNLYDVPTGGSSLWTEVHDVMVAKGRFQLILGSITPFDDPNRDGDDEDAIDFGSAGGSHFIGLRIADAPGLAEMIPRQRLIPAYHAYRADTVPDGAIDTDQLAGSDTAPFVPGAVTTEKIADGSVTVPKISLDVRTSLMPLGAVIIWTGSLNPFHATSNPTGVPPDWELADGGTVALNPPKAMSGVQKPDLRDRFVLGADQAMHASVQLNGTHEGGANTLSGLRTSLVTMTEADMPDHTHDQDLGTTQNTHTHDDGQLLDDRSKCTTGRTLNGDDNDPAQYIGLGRANSPLPCPNLGDGLGSGLHNHDLSGEILENESTARAHDHGFADMDNRPAFTEVYFIIRVN
jgi:hypothetical protein